MIIIDTGSRRRRNMENAMIPGLRVSVIGAGIVGLAVADALCRRGATVTVLERDRIAQGTTDNSFAWVNATSKTEDEAYHRLNAAGLDAWRARAREFGEDAVGLHSGGMVEWIDAADPAANAAMNERIRRLKAWDYPARAVDRTGLAALEPHFDYPPSARGVYAFGDAWLDAPRAAAHLAACIRSGGGTIREHCTAQAVRRTNGAVESVETDADRIPSRHVVIAAGHETNAVVAKLTGDPAFASRGPVGAVPGALVQTPPCSPHRWVRRVVYCQHHGPLHLRPAPDGGLLLGGDDTDEWIARGHQDALLERIESTLLQRAGKLIPGLPVDRWRGRCERRVGVRPMPADGRSVIGEVPNAPGVFLAATHSGVTLALVIGKLLADRITSGKYPAMLDPFACHRFAESTESHAVDLH